MLTITSDQAFSSKGSEYELESQTNPIVKFTRNQVYRHLLSLRKPPASVLEINAGSGYDALNLARMGYRVLATDSAQGMVTMIRKKKHPNLRTRQLSFFDLNLDQTFDIILSNFGGLNTTGDLERIFRQFPNLLNEDGHVVLTVLNPLCVWEFANLPWSRETATRRLNWLRRRPASANIDGTSVDTYYYTPAQVREAMPSELRLVKIQGLSAIVPPPYMKHICRRFPRLYSALERAEARLSTIWPFSRLGDYFIASFRKSSS